MTSEELRDKFTELNHPCAIRHIHYEDHDRYDPCIILSKINGIKPGLVLWDGMSINIIDAANIGNSLDDACQYLLATDEVLAKLMDQETL